MQALAELKARLTGLDGRDYGAYQALLGDWAYPAFGLRIDRIPKDPFASPHTGVYRVRIPLAQTGIAPELWSSRVREAALRDFLIREVRAACERLSPGRRGTGNSGVITIAQSGQQILERSAVVLEGGVSAGSALNGGTLEARLFLGLPADGRRIRADLAETMLCGELPRIVAASLFLDDARRERAWRHIRAAEDSAALRGALPGLGLVAFIAEGARLPRASGADDRPLDPAQAEPFHVPPSLRVTVRLPHAGAVSGLGIPSGVTLIVGGGYHGKSTLLQALERGIYDHIPGDGRENCVALPDTMKIRAASGRSVTATDISAFIGAIPRGADTAAFSSTNASGSTSQAASIAEAMEVGAGVLLLDEDTSATNFMIRDKRMQELVAKQDEPITAFVDRVKPLHTEHGISTVLVMGGSGDYFGVADCVIQMLAFQPRDVTAAAREIAVRFPTARTAEGRGALLRPRARRPSAQGLDPRNAHGHFRIRAGGPHRLTYGSRTIDLSDVEQLVDAAQTRAIGRAIHLASPWMDGGLTLRELAGRIMAHLARQGLDGLDPERGGDLAVFRALELAATLNRVRGLVVTQDR